MYSALCKTIGMMVDGRRKTASRSRESDILNLAVSSVNREACLFWASYKSASDFKLNVERELMRASKG